MNTNNNMTRLNNISIFILFIFYFVYTLTLTERPRVSSLSWRRWCSGSRSCSCTLWRTLQAGCAQHSHNPRTPHPGARHCRPQGRRSHPAHTQAQESIRRNKWKSSNATKGYLVATAYKRVYGELWMLQFNNKCWGETQKTCKWWRH